MNDMLKNIRWWKFQSLFKKRTKNEKELVAFLERIYGGQEDCDPRFSKVVDKHFWSLK